MLLLQIFLMEIETNVLSTTSSLSSATNSSQSFLSINNNINLVLQLNTYYTKCFRLYPNIEDV